MNQVSSKPQGPNWWGHKMGTLSGGSINKEGYAACGNCAAVENTNESIQPCPKAEYLHTSVIRSIVEKMSVPPHDLTSNGMICKCWCNPKHRHLPENDSWHFSHNDLIDREELKKKFKFIPS